MKACTRYAKLRAEMEKIAWELCGGKTVYLFRYVSQRIMFVLLTLPTHTIKSAIKKGEEVLGGGLLVAWNVSSAYARGFPLPTSTA